MFKSNLSKIILISILITVLIITALLIRSLFIIRADIQPASDTNFTLQPNFIVSFSKKLTDQDIPQFKITPNANLTINNQNPVFNLAPESILSPDTQYVFTVSINNQIIQSTTYVTKKITEITENEQMLIQQSSDLEYADRYEKTLTEKPWIKLLPLTDKDYTVVYDSETGGLDIYPKRTFTETEKNNLLKHLNTLNIPTTNVLWF